MPLVTAVLGGEICAGRNVNHWGQGAEVAEEAANYGRNDHMWDKLCKSSRCFEVKLFLREVPRILSKLHRELCEYPRDLLLR